MSRAIVLFAHGSRDAAWARPFESLRAQMLALLPQTPVETAYLELMPPTLEQCVERLIGQGASDITVVPVFFAQGTHLRHELPAMIETLRTAWPERSINVTPPIGEQPEVLAAIAACIARLAAPGR